jgi:hypothetical protein
MQSLVSRSARNWQRALALQLAEPGDMRLFKVAR